MWLEEVDEVMKVWFGYNEIVFGKSFWFNFVKI